VLSAGYVVGYLLQATIALGIGALATTAGLLPALELGSTAVLAVGLSALALAVAGRRVPAMEL
jgi:hypothetical protein